MRTVIKEKIDDLLDMYFNEVTETQQADPVFIFIDSKKEEFISVPTEQLIHILDNNKGSFKKILKFMKSTIESKSGLHIDMTVFLSEIYYTSVAKEEEKEFMKNYTSLADTMASFEGVSIIIEKEDGVNGKIYPIVYNTKNDKRSVGEAVKEMDIEHIKGTEDYTKFMNNSRLTGVFADE